MRRYKFGATALVAMLLCIARPGNAQLVTNGGFETGDLTGWIQSGPCVYALLVATPHSGSFAYADGSYTGVCSLSQSISTVAGQPYDISFWLANVGGGSSTSFSVLWGGSSLLSLSNTAAFDYVHQTFGVVGGAGTSTMLEFQFLHEPEYWALDDVSVTPADVVPEPASMTLLATGLVGMVGAGMKRRRKKA